MKATKNITKKKQRRRRRRRKQQQVLTWIHQRIATPTYNNSIYDSPSTTTAVAFESWAEKEEENSVCCVLREKCECKWRCDWNTPISHYVYQIYIHIGLSCKNCVSHQEEKPISITADVYKKKNSCIYGKCEIKREYCNDNEMKGGNAYAYIFFMSRSVRATIINKDFDHLSERKWKKKGWRKIAEVQEKYKCKAYKHFHSTNYANVFIMYITDAHIGDKLKEISCRRKMRDAKMKNGWKESFFFK